MKSQKNNHFANISMSPIHYAQSHNQYRNFEIIPMMFPQRPQSSKIAQSIDFAKPAKSLYRGHIV